MRRMKKKWFLLAPLIITGAALFFAAGGLLVQSLWNWLLPPLFGWHTVTFWQSLGLLLLSRILFGGWSGGRGNFGRRRRWRRQNDLWATMTPEERQQFQERLRARCGGGVPA